MEGNSSEDYGNGGVSSPREGISDGQRCQSIDSLAEWRSSEQVENGTPSTSPPFWDTDDDEDDCGPRPSELYGKFTWKIENFSQINKRELRSNAFEVGSYKWYILIYPQGCDVCNHLSLFLCVANHDKLLPGWSHFAQFTIAVVNKDPKKTKYSDTVHRFWKKEHDWGWKKFMELSKVLDGFINNDTLVIKAQVQVIREKANHLFRCLDCQYRREVLRVYLSNVEQICRTFFEDRKKKLCDLIGDKIRWSSFCTFWLEIDQNSRWRMSKEKSDTILRVVVKHFFVEKEVTSTLVMDSLYSGLKALECQSKNKKERLKIEIDESPAPMIRVDKDMFVLSDDVLLLLERVASDPLPTISSPPKDDKASQNRTKEGSSGEEFNKDSIERDERRLTELGRRTVEIFVLAHIFSSRIEVAYQEAVALKRQEELIREEEAAGQAENELKAKRAAAEKEKRTKKKQAKPKRNNRRSKDKQRDLKTDLVLNENYQEENSLDVMASGELSAKQGHLMNERLDAQENASDVSCTGDDVVEPHYRDLEDRASSPLNWGMDASEVHPSMEASACEISNGRPGKMSNVLDDSSSTCSTDSVPSLFSNGPCKGNSVILNKNQTSPNRVNTHSRKDSQNHPYVGRHSGDILDSCMSICSELEVDIVSLKRPIQLPERHLVEKQDATATLNKKAVKDQGVAERLSSIRILESFSASPGSGRKTQPLLLQAKQSLQSGKIATNAASLASIAVPALIKEPSTSSVTVPKRAAVSAKLLQSSTSQSEAQKLASAPPSKDNAAQPVNAISRPSSAPLIPAVPKTNTPVISMGQVMPHLSRSVSAAGRFPVDPSSASSYGPQSYRNAIIGKNTIGSSPTGFTYSVSSSLGQASTSSSHSSTTTFLASMLPPPSTTKKEDRQQMASKPGFTFGSVKPEALHFQKQQRDDGTHNEPTSSSACLEPPTTSGLFKSNIVNDIERPDICPDQRTKHQGESLSSSPLLPGSTADEFPHMDIINDLLDDEQSIMEKAVSISSHYHTHHLCHQSFSRQYSLPVDVISTDLGSISNSSGRFEQIDHYCNDGLQSINGRSFGGGLHRLRDDHLAQVDLSSAYASGQMDGLIQGQWPYSHADLSIMNLSSSDGSGYTYQHLSDYANMGTQLNGYGLYRP